MAAAWRAWLDEVNAKAQLAEVCTLVPSFCRMSACCLHVFAHCLLLNACAPQKGHGQQMEYAC